MTDTIKPWQQQMADRLLGTAPAASEADQAAARRAARRPAPQWAQRLAERALGAEEPDDTPPPAA